MKSEALPYLVDYVMHESALICLVFGGDGIIRLANDYADSISGKTLNGRPLNDFFIDFGGTFNFESFQTASSKRKLIHVSTSSNLPESFLFRFFNLGDEILAVGETNSQEISLLRKNLLELNRDLNNLTRELQKKNAELKKLNDLKNHFMGIAAHDLRNPVGIIMGYSDFLLDELSGELSVDQRNMLNTIQKTSEFMLHLLNELLDITAIESGKLRLELKRQDLLLLVRKNAALNALIAAKKNISIRVDSFEEIPEVWIDSNKLEQVMNNLISNAIKFSQPGTAVAVKVFLSGNHITIGVADQGVGIPADEIDQLFKPFQKISTRSTAGEKSTGLGLSIVRNIIMGHQGKIWVDSKVGVGSTFYFSLPLGGKLESL